MFIRTGHVRIGHGCRYRELFENVIKLNRGASLKPSQRLQVRWFKPLAEAIDKEQVRRRDLGRKRYMYSGFSLSSSPPSPHSPTSLSCANCLSLFGVVFGRSPHDC